jgi:hypothetical protein
MDGSGRAGSAFSTINIYFVMLQTPQPREPRMSDSMYDEVRNTEDAAAIKANAARETAERAIIGRLWRADLWADVPAAIHWANQDPVSLPGEIVFNIRDNGQVWTYTYL